MPRTRGHNTLQQVSFVRFRQRCLDHQTTVQLRYRYWARARAQLRYRYGYGYWYWYGHGAFTGTGTCACKPSLGGANFLSTNCCLLLPHFCSFFLLACSVLYSCLWHALSFYSSNDWFSFFVHSPLSFGVCLLCPFPYLVVVSSISFSVYQCFQIRQVPLFQCFSGQTLISFPF